MKKSDKLFLASVISGIIGMLILFSIDYRIGIGVILLIWSDTFLDLRQIEIKKEQFKE